MTSLENNRFGLCDHKMKAQKEEESTTGSIEGRSEAKGGKEGPPR